jgi:hypothetical protein
MSWRSSSSWTARRWSGPRASGGPHNRLGWSIQWGTVRMLGTFLTDSGLAGVPEVVIRYVAEQLGIGNWTSVKLYGDRQQTP